MRRRPKTHISAQVVYDATCFLIFLRDFRCVVYGPVDKWDSRAKIDRKALAAKVWLEHLSKLGKQLLHVGNDWAMSDWVDERTEWTQQLQSLFRHSFESIQDFIYEWGTALEQFLVDGDGHREPLGFRTDEPHDDRYRREAMFRDVELDVRALLAAANERMQRDLANPKPLTDLQKEVLKLIPQGTSEGITGKEIVSKLADMSLAQSTLTRHVIPVLKKYYGVCNDRAVGYFRLLEPRNARIGAAYIR